MARNIKGITIEIGGNTTKLTNAIKQANNSIRAANSSLRDINRLSKIDAGSIELYKQKLEQTKKAIASTEEKLRTLKEAEKQASEQFKRGEISKDTYDALKREIISTEQALKKLKKEQKEIKGNAPIRLPKIFGDLGGKIKSAIPSAKSLAKAFANLGTNAVKATAKAIGGVSALMQAGAVMGLKYNAEIEQLTTSFEVMTGSTQKATELTKKLKDLGAKTPYDLKGLSQTTQTLMQYGLSADDAYNATLSMGDIAQGSADKMQSIALAFGQMSSAGKVNMQDIKQMINAGFNPLQAIAEKTGKTMQEVTADYEAGKLTIQDVKDAMAFASSEGGKYYKSMEKQSQTFKGQLDTAKEGVQSLAGTISGSLSKSMASDLLPSINKTIEGLEKAFNTGGLSAFSNELGKSIADIIVKIGEKAPQMINAAGTLISGFVAGLSNNSGKIAKTIVQIASTLIKNIATIIPQIVDAALKIIPELMQGIIQELPTLIPVVINGLLQIITSISENLPLFLKMGGDLLLAITDGIVNALPSLIDALPQIIEGIVAFIIESLPQIIMVGLEIIVKLAFGLIKAIPQLIAMLPKIISAIVRGLLRGAGDLLDTGGSLVDTIKQGLKDGISKIFEIGGELVSGLWSGIKNKAGDFKKKITGWAKGIIKNVKDTFKIKSPSKVFSYFGKMNVAGLEQGFEDSIPGAQRKIQKAMKQITSGVDTSINPTINPDASVNTVQINIEKFENNTEQDIQELARLLEFYRRNASLSKGGIN